MKNIEGIDLIAKTAIKVRKEWVGNTICIVLLIIAFALMLWVKASDANNRKLLKGVLYTLMGGLASLIVLFTIFFSPAGKESTGRYKYKVQADYSAPQSSITALYENYSVETVDVKNRIYIIKDIP